MERVLRCGISTPFHDSESRMELKLSSRDAQPFPGKSDDCLLALPALASEHIVNVKSIQLGAIPPKAVFSEHAYDDIALGRATLAVHRS